jgi:signal transduction histidine kinase
VRHSSARKIEIELEYGKKSLRVLIRDNGCGIDPEVLRSRRSAHWGLPGMLERAAGIKAKLRVLSRVGEGTEIQLAVPGSVAFDSQSSRPPSTGLTSQGPLSESPMP